MTSRLYGFSLEDDLMPIIRGEVPIPNFEEMPLSEAVNRAAAFGNVLDARIQFPGATKWDRPRAIVALEKGQGGSFHGSGIVLYEGGYPHGAKAGRFAICKHEPVDGPGADHRRGWHPARCARCGLDMSVDSGD